MSSEAAFGTRVGRLGRGTLLAASAAIVTLHSACYLVALITAPRLTNSDVFIQREKEEDGTGGYAFALEDVNLNHWNERLIGSLEISSSEEGFTSLKRFNFSGTLRSPSQEYDIQDAIRILDGCMPDERNVSFNCLVDPLFDLRLLARNNESLLVTLNYSEPFANLSLVARIESPNFHKTLFFFKCVFTPGLILSLVYFSWKIHVNDLYIAIPDRCLIVSGIALFLRNVPLEALLTHNYLALLEPLTRGFLLCSLYLFWLIYSGDKVSEKESWERNSRYYWKEILLIVLFAIIYILHVSYSTLPSLQNPFKNHWNSSRYSRIISYVFKLSTSGCIVLPLQIFLSVRVFRILFLYRRGKEVSRRLGWTLMYMYSTSLVTTGDFLLRESLQLSRVRETLSGVASILMIGAEGFWNLHIIFCFILLSRAPPSSVGLKDMNSASLGYGARPDGERKEFEEVLGLSVYNHLLQEKD